LSFFKYLLVFLVGSITGATVFLAGESYLKLGDEAFYTRKVNQALLWNQRGDTGGVNEALNDLLMIHMNRYKHAREYTPSGIAEGLDLAICAAFMGESSDVDPFNSAITKKGLKDYLKSSLSFCEVDLLI